jgi:hypothetical protein
MPQYLLFSAVFLGGTKEGSEGRGFCHLPPAQEHREQSAGLPARRDLLMECRDQVQKYESDYY